MKFNDPQIKEILLREQYVTEADWQRAESSARASRGSAVESLLDNGAITKDLLGQAIAEFFKMPYADLNSHQPPREQVLMMPEAAAKKFHAVIFSEEKEALQIATDNPSAPGLRPALEQAFPGRRAEVLYSLPDDIAAAMRHYRPALETRFEKIIKQQGRVAPEIIDEIFADAMSCRASDIHFEPAEREAIVRFRVDGILREAGRIPKNYYENIVNRVKVLAHLRIDEHFAAQDGAIRYARPGIEADMRVSIVPTLDGETVVIRLLTSYVRGITLEGLGLSASHQRLLESIGHKPFGMIVVAGPTGSGKTTTLYGLLKLLNQPEVNITTIEDPVEYKLAGVNQIQVNSQTGLTFSKGLRSIVRQDPNIILVGEIRDKETAEIAVNAALTGHLLLSTFHANDAPTALVRLLHMGIEPFLLASTAELIIAQRLVRKVCEHCRYSFTAHPEDIEKIAPGILAYFTGAETFYRGKGCAECGDSGFLGRIGIFEFIAMSPALQSLILQNPSARQIIDMVRQDNSYRTLFEDGVEHVKNGLTTLEELARVAAPPRNMPEEKRSRGSIQKVLTKEQ